MIFECIILLFTGTSLLFSAFALDIRRNLREMNDVVGTGEDLPSERMELKKQLYEIIKFHSESSNLVRNFIHIYRLCLTSYLAFSMVLIGICLLIGSTVSLFVIGFDSKQK